MSTSGTQSQMTFMREVDCGRYSTDRYTPVCEERAQAAVGVGLVLGLVVILIGLLLWRRKVKQYTTRRLVSDDDGSDGGDE